MGEVGKLEKRSASRALAFCRYGSASGCADGPLPRATCRGATWGRLRRLRASWGHHSRRANVRPVGRGARVRGVVHGSASPLTASGVAFGALIADCNAAGGQIPTPICRWSRGINDLGRIAYRGSRGA